MTITDRDQLIRAALTPAADLGVPADLGAQIHDRIVEMPQRRPGLARIAGPFRRFVPETPLLPRPAVVWLTALLLLVVAAMAVIGVASRFQPPAPLSMTSYRGGPAQDGNLAGPGPVGAAAILRDLELTGPMTFSSAPLVRDGVVYLADTRGGVTARNAVDLTEVWTSLEAGPGGAAPILLGDVLVVAGHDGTVVGLDPATGENRWTQRLGMGVAAPLAGVGDRVVVSSTDGTVSVLSATDGVVVGSFDAGAPVNRSPAIANGIGYAGADTGIVTAFDVATAERLWSIDLTGGEVSPSADTEMSTPAYANGTVYVVRGRLDLSVPHEVVAIDVTARAVRWRSPSPTPERLFVGAVTDDAVITVGEDGAIRRLDPATGAITPLYENTAGMGSPASVVGPTLYVSSYDGMVRAIDVVTGVERWRVQVQGRPTMPVVVDGRVYVGTDVGLAVLIGDPGG